MNKRKSLWSKLKSYKLDVQVIIALILLLVFVLSIIFYLIPDVRGNEIAANLLLALFTSLLVSVFTLSADIIVAYNQHKNETYLENLREFGIGNLYSNKEIILREYLQDCDHLIWISGYRLILTRKLEREIGESIERGADFRALICPPWTEAFKMVYGTNEKVMDNYFIIFHSVHEARKATKKDSRRDSVVFVNKPIFSDTYRIDQKLITGPYMHNRDRKYNRLMAKDFFSYDIIKQSSLSKLINDEYETLFGEAVSRLDWALFEKAYVQFKTQDLREAEKIELLKNACVPIHSEPGDA